MKFNSFRKNTTFSKIVYAIFAIVGLLFLVQVGIFVWGVGEVINSVQDSGGVKSALIELAKDAKDIKEAYDAQ
jgi:CHASE3 domain sensor protein